MLQEHSGEITKEGLTFTNFMFILADIYTPGDPQHLQLADTVTTAIEEQSFPEEYSPETLVVVYLAFTRMQDKQQISSFNTTKLPFAELSNKL